MGNSQVAAGLIDESIRSFNKGNQIFNKMIDDEDGGEITKELIDKKTNSSWNMSCALLKQGSFVKGGNYLTMD